MTKQEAKEALVLAGLRQFKPGQWCYRGTYYLSHGEFSPPTIRIKKIRNKDDYYIQEEVFYLWGTFNTPDKFSDITENILYKIAEMSDAEKDCALDMAQAS